MITLEWPSWHPQHELKADDLLGLEEYLLARVLIVDEGAYGVDIFDWQLSLDEEASDSGITLRVHALRGATPIGEPVWLRKFKPDEPTGWLETKLATPPFEDFYFDLWIVVNDRNEEAHKLTLLAEIVQPSVEPIIPGEEENCHRLYLGRYFRAQRAQGVQLKLVHRPMPRRLGGSGPVEDDAWQKWVRPLRTSLEELSRDITGQKGYDAATLALAAELLRLSFEWPALPIPILVRRLRLVHWLWERSSNPDIAPNPVDSIKLLDDYFTWTGDALPEKLAAMLPLPGQRSEGFTQSVKRLLDDLLAQGGVDYHAPLEDFRAWVEQLEGGAARLGSAAEMTALANRLEEVLTRSSIPGGRDLWSQAVAFITILKIRMNGGSDAERGPERYSTAGLIDLPQNAARVIEDVYKVARQVPAGPLAFYWLAQAAAHLPDLAKHSPIAVRSYFLHLGGTVEFAPRKSSGMGRTNPQTGDGVDRVAEFLARANARPSVVTQVRPYLWLPKELARRDRRAEFGEIRITVVGNPQSGKTTLIRELVRGCRDFAAPRGSDFGSPGEASEMAAGEARGRFVLDGREINVCLVDGGPATVNSRPPDDRTPESEWPAFWRAASMSDLLILAIQPSSIDRSEPPEEAAVLRDLCIWTLQRRPTALVAIAYTKADEYGVVDPAALRLVNDHAQANRLGSLRNAANMNVAWKDFAQAGEAVGRQTVQIGGGRFHTRSTVSSSCDYAETRRQVLDQTRALWEDLAVRRAPAALLNGYFISAKPRDRFLEPWPHRGLLQMLADFLECIKGST